MDVIFFFLQQISRHPRCSGYPLLHMHFTEQISKEALWCASGRWNSICLLIYHSSNFGLWNSQRPTFHPRTNLRIRRYPTATDQTLQKLKGHEHFYTTFIYFLQPQYWHIPPLPPLTESLWTSLCCYFITATKTKMVLAGRHLCNAN